MLIPNLSVLLAERRLTLSKVSSDTGLSRTTLTALAGRAARGVQFDTLNTLCQYLKVTPNDLFIYRPFDLSVACEGLPDTASAAFTLTRAGAPALTCALPCAAQYRRAPGDPPRLEALTLRLFQPEGDPDAARLVELLRALPRPALAEVELMLLRPFDANIDPALAPDDYAPEVLWPWETSVPGEY